MLTLPTLKIVHLDEVVLHEEHSPERVERLAERIKKDRFLRNPIIVARIKNIGKYMVLDGATRTTALKKLQFRDVLVQIVDYESDSITLDTWHHLMPAGGGRPFLDEVKENFGVEVEAANMQIAEQLLRNREIMSYFLFFDNTCFMIRERTGKLSEQTRKMRDIVLACESLGKIVRIHYSDLGENLKKNGKIYMANIFPAYSKEELIRLAKSGLKLPAGITRHLVPGRVLGFEVESEILEDRSASLQKKNEIIQEIYDRKIFENRMRYYSEAVYIFNE